MPPNPTREEYKAIYDAPEGEVLKFQAFHPSWKNVSHNLGTVNDVLQSTGAHHAAAAAAAAASKSATGPALAGDSTCFWW